MVSPCFLRDSCPFVAEDVKIDLLDRRLLRELVLGHGSGLSRWTTSRSLPYAITVILVTPLPARSQLCPGSRCGRRQA